VESYKCRTCDGHKEIEQFLRLHEACPTCAGNGYVDWIAHAMGKKSELSPSFSFRNNLMQKNIHMLTNEIRRQGALMGIRVDVDIRFERGINDYTRVECERMMMHAQSPILYP
jgi:hypothetical protein